MLKCAASAATSIESLNELVCVSCHIFIDFTKSLKVYFHECATFAFLVSIKYEQRLPPKPSNHIVQTAMLFILQVVEKSCGKQPLGRLKRRC
jgi:hypothetical protein